MSTFMIMQFKERNAQYKVINQLDFINNILDAKVQQLFCASLGDWYNDGRTYSVPPEKYSAWNLVWALNKKQYVIFIEEYAKLTGLPPLIIEAFSKGLGVTYMGNSCFVDLPIKWVGKSFLSYALACFNESIFKDNFEIITCEAERYKKLPCIRVEVFQQSLMDIFDLPMQYHIGKQRKKKGISRDD